MLQTSRQCVVWQGPEDIQLVERDLPALKKGELLVKVESCAICGSDLRIYKHGNPRVAAGTIIGHEIAGQIVDIGGSHAKLKIGDNVAVGADVPCGACTHCQSGRANCCDINYAIGHQFEGGFTQYMIINQLTASLGPVHVIKNDLSYDEAALAEPLACCINGYERGLMTPGRSVVIFGAGPIGIMLAMLASVYEASTVIMVDPNQSRLDRARLLGVAHTVNPNSVDPVSYIMEMTKGLGAEMIFTACPAVETHQQAIKILAKRGVVNFFGGLPKDAPEISVLSNFIHYREAYLTGSHGSTPEQHKKAVDLIESGRVNVRELITHRYPLADINAAYQTAASGHAIKVIIKPHAYAQ